MRPRVPSAPRVPSVGRARSEPPAPEPAEPRAPSEGLGHRFERVPVHAGGLPYRAELESRFAADFSTVEVALGRGELRRAGVRAAARAESIAFADARPEKSLVAHELTHVMQHRHADGAPARAVSRPGDAAEREADTLGARAAGGASVAPREAPAAAWQFARYKPGDTVRYRGDLCIVFEVLKDGGSDESASSYRITVRGERVVASGAEVEPYVPSQPPAPSGPSGTASTEPPAPPSKPAETVSATPSSKLETAPTTTVKPETKEKAATSTNKAPPMARLKSKPMKFDAMEAVADEWLEHSAFKTPEASQKDHPLTVAQGVTKSIKDEITDVIPNAEAIASQPWAKKNAEYNEFQPGTGSAAHDEADTTQGLMIHRVINAKFMGIIWLTASPEYVVGKKKGVGVTLMLPAIEEAESKGMGMRVSPEGDDARGFYLKFGFVQSPINPKELWRPSPILAAAMKGKKEATQTAMLKAECEYGVDTKTDLTGLKTKLAKLGAEE